MIPEAKAALNKGDATPILKRAKAGDDAEVKTEFAKAGARVVPEHR